MKVTVEYSSQIRRIGGVSSETVELDTSCQVQELVKQLAGDHGESFRSLIIDSAGNLQSTILVFVNDKQISRDASVEVADNDMVHIIAPMAGG